MSEGKGEAEGRALPKAFGFDPDPALMGLEAVLEVVLQNQAKKLAAGR